MKKGTYFLLFFVCRDKFLHSDARLPDGKTIVKQSGTDPRVNLF